MEALALFDASTAGQRCYDIQDEIGHGSYSEVHAAVERSSGHKVALKQLYLSEDRAIPQHAQREIAALRRLCHPNVIRLLDTQQEGYGLSLVLELCLTDVRWVLAASRCAPPAPITKALTRQMLGALAACHAAGVWHRDLAPSNLLIAEDGSLRLADFGHSWVSDEEMGGEKSGSAPPPTPALTPGVGTRWYKAPEVLLGSRHYGAGADMWSAGAVFGELLSGGALLPGTSDIDQICRASAALGGLTPQAWPGIEDCPDWGKLRFLPTPATPWREVCPAASDGALDLLASFLVLDPARRVTAGQALEHRYFSEHPAPASDAQVLAFVQGLAGATQRR